MVRTFRFALGSHQFGEDCMNNEKNGGKTKIPFVIYIQNKIKCSETTKFKQSNRSMFGLNPN